jgi:hypothetical protein
MSQQFGDWACRQPNSTPTPLQVLFEEFRLGRFQSHHVGGCPDGYLRIRDGDWRPIAAAADPAATSDRPLSGASWEPGQFCGSQKNRSRWAHIKLRRGYSLVFQIELLILIWLNLKLYILHLIARRAMYKIFKYIDIQCTVCENICAHYLLELTRPLSQSAFIVCGFDSRRHTQILYKENRKLLFGAKKTKGKKCIVSYSQAGAKIWCRYLQ